MIILHGRHRHTHTNTPLLTLYSDSTSSPMNFTFFHAQSPSLLGIPLAQPALSALCGAPGGDHRLWSATVRNQPLGQKQGYINVILLSVTLLHRTYSLCLHPSRFSLHHGLAMSLYIHIPTTRSLWPPSSARSSLPAPPSAHLAQPIPRAVDISSVSST